jgi:UDP-N-acetylglucosamine 2-epimerase (non-hydrolysing)
VLITHVVGARPNFMKAAPVLSEFKRRGWPQMLIHTGQHYDELMSDLQFRQLEIPQPDVNLGVGSGTHAQQTAAVMTGMETTLLERRPDVLMVYGDVNSTLAATITAAKLEIPVAHVEAGLRSFDRSMPEEINRMVTDRLSTYLFTPSADGDENLRNEGVDPARIIRVGNVMIDSLIRCLPVADSARVLRPLGIASDPGFILVTLHRPATVDDPAVLEPMLDVLATLAKTLPVVFPVHPRTKARMASKWSSTTGLHLIDPVGYLEFLGLEKDATLVITDSGGVQEETTYLRVPCLTVRDNTERPVTVTTGTNTIVGRDPVRLLDTACERLEHRAVAGSIPELWDGKAAARIADALTSVAEG